MEDRLNSSDHPSTEIWLERFRQGQFVGGGWTEASNTKFGEIGTRITTSEGVTRITGNKYYATGSLYADWLDVIGRNENDELVTALVAREQPGVTLIDDWEGFGQQTTASGSARYQDAVVDEHGTFPAEQRFAYQGLFYQTALLSVLVGIGRAAFRDGSDGLRRRTRNYPLGVNEVPPQDPLLQQQIGRIATRLFQAEAALEKQSATLDVVAHAHARGDVEREKSALVDATVRTHEAQSVIIDSVLEITATIFDAWALRRPQSHRHSTGTGATPGRCPPTTRGCSRNVSSATTTSTGPCRSVVRIRMRVRRDKGSRRWATDVKVMCFWA